MDETEEIEDGADCATPAQATAESAVEESQMRCRRVVLDQISTLLRAVERARDTIADSPELAPGALRLLAQTVKKQGVVAKVNAEHKSYYAAMSRLQKAADSRYRVDTSTFVDRRVALCRPVLRMGVLHHMLRRGYFRAAERYVRDAHIPADERRMKLFEDLSQHVAKLRQGDPSSALGWVHEHREQVCELSPHLPFALHRRQFLATLRVACEPGTTDRQGAYVRALSYAQEHFPHHASTSLVTIQRLMGLLALVGPAGGPATMQHAQQLITQEELRPVDELSAHNDPTLEEAFSAAFLRVSGVGAEEVLVKAVSAGILALPTLTKLAALLAPSGRTWHDGEELAVAVDLGPHHVYDSVFICPVSRVAATDSNPPVLLRCGHALCRDAMLRLPRYRGRFKCPTCPMECSDAQVVTLTV